MSIPALLPPNNVILGGEDNFKCNLFAVSRLIIVTELPVSGRPMQFINFFPPPGAASHNGVVFSLLPLLVVATSTAAVLL